MRTIEWVIRGFALQVARIPDHMIFAVQLFQSCPLSLQRRALVLSSFRCRGGPTVTCNTLSFRTKKGRRGVSPYWARTVMSMSSPSKLGSWRLELVSALSVSVQNTNTSAGSTCKDSNTSRKDTRGSILGSSSWLTRLRASSRH